MNPIRRRLRVDRVAFQGGIGAALVGAIGLATLFAPLLTRHAPGELVGEVWASPAARAWLGLDNLGRDMWSRLLFGGRITLLISLSGTLLAFVIGAPLGLVAAVRGGWVEAALARTVDALMAIPPLIFALVLLSVLGTSVPILIGTVALLASTRVFRLTRALAADIVALDYFEAARLRQESLTWLAGGEVLPNLASPLSTEFGLRLCANFLLVASLSFLGLGIQPPLADWGSMVRDNAAAIGFGGVAPLMPAAAIGLFTIGVNLMVDSRLARKSRGHA